MLVVTIDAGKTNRHVGHMKGVLDMADLALGIDGGIHDCGFQQVDFHRGIVALLAILRDPAVRLGNSAG